MLNSFLKHCRSESGITLIEAVILILIIAVATVPLSRLAITNLKSTTQSMMISELVCYAEGSMEEIVSVGRNMGVEAISDGYVFSFQIPNTLNRSVSVTSDTLDGIGYTQVMVTVGNNEVGDYSLTTLLR
jgi:Tfp pilus assembly protein PilV